jgi:predicted Zn-dependent protease
MPKKNKKNQSNSKDKTGDERKKRFRLPPIPTLENPDGLDMFAASANDNSDDEQPLYTLQEEDTTSNIDNVNDVFAFLLETENFLRSLSSRRLNNTNPPIQVDKDLEILAENSVADNEQIASETLAQILLGQGQIQKAVNMYKRLQAQQPEKSAYFEQLIAQAQAKNKNK